MFRIELSSTCSSSGRRKQLTVIMGDVRSPQAKNSRNITTNAWWTLGSDILVLSDLNMG